MHRLWPVRLHPRARLLLTNPAERFRDESWRDAEAFAHEVLQHGPKGQERSMLAGMHQYAERAPDDQSTLLGHRAPGPLVDEEQVSMERLGEQDGGGLSGVQTQVDAGKSTPIDAQPGR